MIRSPLMTVMTDAVLKAARSLKRDFGEVENLQVSRKGPGDFVSAADRRAEEIIRSELERARPGYTFLMEESGETRGADPQHRWIVDPLDGTTNFLHGIPLFSISIALERRGRLPQRPAAAGRGAPEPRRRRGGDRHPPYRPRRSRRLPQAARGRHVV